MRKGLFDDKGRWARRPAGQARRLSYPAALGLFVGLAMEGHAQYATSLISFNSGTGAVSGFDQPGSVLGMPSTFTNHQFGGPVDPFNPAFLPEQIVSIGAGGSLTVDFGAPVRNDAGNPFGLNFIIYGNAGFLFSDFNAGKTAGELFGAASPGATRVSVSADNVQYFTLDSSLAPTVDRYFPTDGAGTFGTPVNPALANAPSFNDMNLSQIRAQYGGSAGGAGFDLAWARDTSGNAVSLDSIRFVRVEVLSGAAEVDGFAAVPEPSTWALSGLGAFGVFFRKRRL